MNTIAFRSKRLKLTDSQKTFIKNNSAKFTAKELAEWSGTYPALIGNFCKSNNYQLKKADGKHNPPNRTELIYFNVDSRKDWIV